MLVGQNGTGKELMARAIHAASPRRDKAFVALHCRGASESELEASIFGDPADTSSGALQQTNGGTLFLEEVGELPVRLQARLVNEVRLHAHETTQADNAKRLDVRLICTTSSDLKPAIASGQFRQDLYYQIHMMAIEVPPLGRRREDIPLLVSHFLEQATEQTGKHRIYTPKAIELLATKDWPGNVRQLFELVKRNVALTHEEVITEDHVRESLGDETPTVPGYDEAREQFSREYLVENLQRTSGNVAEAARLAKRNRSDFYNLLARFRLNAADFKNTGPEVQTVKPAPQLSSPR
jgi:two-component system, NtrC family, response regulator GlrR